MKLGAIGLRQRDGVTCGPTVAVVASAILDPGYRAALSEPGARIWFAGEQGRVHAEVNRLWPRRLGTTPMGMARALSERGVRYRWRTFRGGRDRLTDVLGAVNAGKPVPMLIGRVIPRHWVLLIGADDDVLQCYEPSSGRVRPVESSAVRQRRLTGLGYPRPFGFVVPHSNV